MQNSTNLKDEWVERIFLLLHGRFGGSFLNKYKLGQVNANGEDAGIANAKATWSHELAGMSAERIKAALDANYEHAPSCDAFKANCKVTKAHEFTAITKAIDYESGKKYADNVVKFVAAHMVEKTDYKAWAKRILANPDRFPAESLVAAKEALRA